MTGERSCCSHCRADTDHTKPCPECARLYGPGVKRVYVASSWRNSYQPEVVSVLLHCGLDVYDFRHPEPGDDGFSWSQIDPDWQSWNPIAFRTALEHPIAVAGHRNDHEAMRWADACVLVLPAGRSAHLEAGMMAGWGKPVAVYIPEHVEPELMYRSLGTGVLCVDLPEVLRVLGIRI